jgi:hypothetical protein
MTLMMGALSGRDPNETLWAVFTVLSRPRGIEDRESEGLITLSRLKAVCKELKVILKVLLQLVESGCTHMLPPLVVTTTSSAACRADQAWVYSYLFLFAPPGWYIQGRPDHDDRCCIQGWPFSWQHCRCGSEDFLQHHEELHPLLISLCFLQRQIY